MLKRASNYVKKIIGVYLKNIKIIVFYYLAQISCFFIVECKEYLICLTSDS